MNAAEAEEILFGYDCASTATGRLLPLHGSNQRMVMLSSGTHGHCARQTDSRQQK